MSVKRQRAKEQTENADNEGVESPAEEKVVFKQAVITFFSDLKVHPMVEFRGVWTGRDITNTMLLLKRSYKQHLRAQAGRGEVVSGGNTEPG